MYPCLKFEFQGRWFLIWGTVDMEKSLQITTEKFEVMQRWASQVALVVKNLPANAGDLRDLGLVPGSGRSPGEGNGNPLQYSCLENSMERGAWWATVPGLVKSQTQFRDWTGNIEVSWIIKIQFFKIKNEVLENILRLKFQGIEGQNFF